MEKIDYQIDEFLDYCSAKNLSIKTIASYEQTLRLISLYLTSQYKITSAEQTKEKHIIKYIKYLKERGKYTIKNKDIIQTNIDSLNNDTIITIREYKKAE